MNTKWEEDLAKTLMEITAKYQTWNYAMNLYNPLKDFIKDQITKAHNNGYEDGFDRAREIALEAITYKPKTN